MFLIKNKIVQWSFLLLAITVFTAQSQEVIDHANFRASYRFLSKSNIGQTDFFNEDLIFVDIGNQVTKSYSRLQQRRDSVMHNAVRQGLSAEEVRNVIRNFRRGDHLTFHHMYHQNKTIATATLIGFDFIYEDEITMPQWTITNVTKNVLGYTSTRAVANYRGREWIVYFTPEIPISRGPWELWGLPGLIVKAYDSENLFRFELTGFEQMVNVPIILHQTSSNGNRFQRIKKNEFTMLERTSFEDALAFFGAVTGRLPNMERPPTRPMQRNHIPLEPWE